MNKYLKVFLVMVLSLFAAGIASTFITDATGIADPTLPMVGTVPIIGGGVMFMIWYFWLRKDKDI